MCTALVAAGEVPDEVGVNVAEEQVACLGDLPRARNVFENPADFQTAKIGRERQTGFAAESVLSSRLSEFSDIIGDARILPRKRIRDWLAGFSIPNEGGLALIGNSNRGKVSRPEAGFRHRLSDYGARVLPDFHGIMFDPSGLRVNLFMFSLRDGQDTS